jgi:hypothetical protein
MSPADSWQRSGMSSDRSYPSGGAPRYERGSADEYGRPSRSVPPPPPPMPRSRAAERARQAERSRSADRSRHVERSRGAERSGPVERNAAPERAHYGQSEEFARPPVSRRSEAGRSGRGERGMPVDRAMAGERGRRDRDMRDRDGWDREPAPDRRTRRPGPEDRPVDRGGSRLRGIVAVLGVFLVSLAGAAIDSFLGVGLGTVTLLALVASTALATLLVRRRDAVTVIVSPPLVFVLVAVVNVGFAPSASFSLATVATLLVRGFPAMGIATGLALLIGLFRLVTRR